MVFGPMPNVKRGRMSAEEIKEVERVICSMKKPTAGKVACKVNRHPATINWYMLRHGYIERKPGRASRPYMRNGKVVNPYTEEHDVRLEALRAEGKVFREIGEILTAEFGIKRSGHSVQVRLVQLTASEGT